jgi:hypothetical protein
MTCCPEATCQNFFTGDEWLSFCAEHLALSLVIILIWLHAECFLSCRCNENCVLYLLILSMRNIDTFQWYDVRNAMGILDAVYVTLNNAYNRLLAGVWLQDGNNFLDLSDCSGVPCLWKAFFNLSPWFSESRERFSTASTTSWINSCKYKIC